MVKVSFVIPIYNAEKYLTECLDSIILQSLVEKEIIIINDGSTDNSLDLAKNYQEQYSYIKIFSQANVGQSVARNFGINVARGEYLFFVDADDYLNHDIVGDVYQLCKQHGLDMIRWKYQPYIDDTKEKPRYLACHGLKYINQPVMVKDFFNEAVKTGEYEVFPWLGLYKRDFLLKYQIDFPAGIIMEDHFFTLQCLTKNPNAVIMQLDVVLYVYRRRPNSTTTNRVIKNILDIKKNAELMLEYISKQNFDDETRSSAYKTVSSLISNTAYIYGRLSETDKKKCVEILPKEMLQFSIKHSINFKQKMVSVLFTYFRFVVDMVYFLKLKIYPGI